MPDPGGIRLRLAAAALLGTALLTGCSVTVPESRIASVASMAPNSWHGTREARAGVDRNWIDRFGDPILTALVVQAMVGNYDLKIAAERVRQAESLAKKAGADLQPVIRASMQGNRSQTRFVGFPFGGGALSFDSYGASVDVAWEADLWGKVRAGQSASIADLQAAGYDLKAVQTSLAAQVAKAWFAIGEAAEQVVLAEAALQIREEIEGAIRERFLEALVDEGGAASQVRLAQTEVASSRATLAFWKAEWHRSLRQMELLLGRYPEGRFLPTRGLPGSPPVPPAGLPSELLLRRPDILAAERRFAAAGKRTREAKQARYPSFTLTGSAGTSTDSLTKILSSNQGIWTLAAGVAAPILEGGRLREDIRIAESDERLALLQLQKTVLNGFGEVEQALVAERYFAEREKAVRESVESAREAAKSSLQDFSDGTVDALTLLSAQDQQIRTALQLANLRRLRLDNRVNLHLALGGDFKIRRK